ncbi:MAG TPA: ketoacyl-ACP synthase III [Myxococcota bacterium]|nr:ketoacyl-ACP synthase III [Myxococcota bacterium]
MLQRSVVLAGTGAHHPAHLVPNVMFDAWFGPGVGDWLVENLAIRQRYWMGEDEATSDLCVPAAREALERAGIGPADVDLLIVATDTPDQPSPSTASVVQHKLGAARAATFDLNTACAGFVTALDVASRFLGLAGPYRHALVIGAYGMSKHLNRADKKTVTLFADGAGAAVLRAEDGPGRGWLGADLVSDGQYWDWMGVYGGGTRRPVTQASIEAHDHQLVFARKFPKEVNPETWSRMVPALCERLGFSPADVDRYVFTQLNIGSIYETLDRLGLPRDRAHTIMDRVGYTGSACIPMALHDAIVTGRVSRGDRIMLVASGGGLTFAAAAIDYV